MTQAIIALTQAFKKDGWHKVGKKGDVLKFIKQNPSSPYLFNCLDFSTEDYRGDPCYRFLSYKFRISESAIFTGDTSLSGYELFWMIGKNVLLETSATSFDSDFKGYDDSDRVDDIISHILPLVNSRAEIGMFDALNRQLFANADQKKELWYPSSKYPMGKPDPERGSYHRPFGDNRIHIFAFFYLLGDIENSLFWLNDILTTPEFNHKSYLKYLHSWADIAQHELKNNLFREVILPKWAPIKSYKPSVGVVATSL